MGDLDFHQSRCAADAAAHRRRSNLDQINVSGSRTFRMDGGAFCRTGKGLPSTAMRGAMRTRCYVVNVCHWKCKSGDS